MTMMLWTQVKKHQICSVLQMGSVVLRRQACRLRLATVKSQQWLCFPIQRSATAKRFARQQCILQVREWLLSAYVFSFAQYEP